MRTLRIALFLGALLPITLAFQPRGTSLTHKVVEGQTLTKTFDQDFTMTIEDVSVTVMGEEMEIPEIPENIIHSTESIVFTDTVGAVADNKAQRVARTFETLNRTRTNTTPDGEESMEETSDLEELEVVFAWDADDEEYAVDFGEDVEDGDTDLLEGIWFEADLAEFLPGGDVEEGDTWEVDYQAWRRLNEPSGDLTFLDEEGESTRDELDDMLSDNVEGEVTCEFKGVREVDGQRVGVIAIHVESETSATLETDMMDMMEPGAVSSATQTREVNVEGEFEGELLWLIEEGRCLSYSGTGSSEIEVIETASISGDMGDFEQTQVLNFLGEGEIEITFE